MDTNSDQEKAFLLELNSLTGGDIEVQVSMYEVGEGLGLDKSLAGSLAEELMVQGQVELRTLAGGISITAEGLSRLGLAPGGTGDMAGVRELSDGVTLDSSDLELIEQVVTSIKDTLTAEGYDYPKLEETVIDLKTIEVHLLSPRPKTAVIKALLLSLAERLGTTNDSPLVARLRQLAG